jgi:hypothetical protein
VLFTSASKGCLESDSTTKNKSPDESRSYKNIYEIYLKHINLFDRNHNHAFKYHCVLLDSSGLLFFVVESLSRHPLLADVNNTSWERRKDSDWSKIGVYKCLILFSKELSLHLINYMYAYWSKPTQQSWNCSSTSLWYLSTLCC